MSLIVKKCLLLKDLKDLHDNKGKDISLINRVFLGTCEPSYFVREKGYEVLREAGIEVYIVDETGVAQGNLRKECLEPNMHLLFDGTDTINRVMREV